MANQRPIILLTRPQAQAERFAQALGDVQTVISPLMRIELLPLGVDLAEYQGLIFTSENGVRACGASDMPAYCVGDRTANAAKAIGMQAVSAGGTADDLVALVVRNAVDGKLLHIRGEHTRGDVAARLRECGQQVDDVVAYRQVAVPLNNQARAALEGEHAVIVPLFSPRTAQLFFKDLGQIKAPLHIIVISEAVGAAVSGDYSVAKAPNSTAMAQAVIRQLSAS